VALFRLSIRRLSACVSLPNWARPGMQTNAARRVVKKVIFMFQSFLELSYFVGFSLRGAITFLWPCFTVAAKAIKTGN
jgi:hypothetical protein